MKKLKSIFSCKKKFILIPVLLVLVIGIMFLVKLLTSGTTYYDVWKSILKSEVGSFRYVIDVRTNPSDSDSVTMAGELTQEELENMETNDTEEEEDTDGITTDDQQEIKDQTVTENEAETWDDIVGQKGELSDEWNSANGTTGSVWAYQNYQLVIEGNTNSVEPLESQFDITLVTQNYNDTLTSVTIIDEKMYIDLEQMKLWLQSSKDDYFVSVSEKLPTNVKSLVIDLDKVVIPASYAEVMETDANLGVVGSNRKLTGILLTFISGLENSLGNTGLGNQDDKYSIDISGKDTSGVFKYLNSFVNNRSSVYNAIVDSYSSELSQEGLEQAKDGKDNFLSATDALYTMLTTQDISNVGLTLKGNAREYETGEGYASKEATIQANWVYNETEYTINIEGGRTGVGSEIKVPNVTKSSVDIDVVWEVMYDIVEYLNFTNIDIRKSLEKTPQSIEDAMLQEFVDLVNGTDATSTRITKLTADTFIQKYAEYEETSDSTPDDIVNAQLAKDFLQAMENVKDFTTGGKDVDLNKDTQIDQFRAVNSSVGDLGIVASYNDDESTAKLGVIDVTLLNKTGSEMKVNTTDFSLQNALSSIFPCNNEVTLKDYDNKFDMSQLKKEVIIPANGYQQVKLYVVLANGLEYMDLFYGNEKVGDIISR